jgi:hypothetical protein
MLFLLVKTASSMILPGLNQVTGAAFVQVMFMHESTKTAKIPAAIGIRSLLDIL